MSDIKTIKINSGYYMGLYKNIKFIISKFNTNNNWYWKYNNKKSCVNYKSKKLALGEFKIYIDNYERAN